nr:ABC transporter substrate-binding protein [Sedimentibacter sp.]
MKTKNMRLAASLLVLCMLITAVGCGSANVQQDAKAVNETSGGAVELLRIGTTKPNDTFSALSQDGAYGKMSYNSFVQAALIEFDENSKIKPGFMTAWEVSEDNRQIIFTFPETGVYWHDGEPVTKEDVEFTFNYYRDVFKSSYFKKIQDIELVGNDKIKITFDQDYAFAFMNEIAFSIYLLPKHVWENVEDPANYRGEDAAIGCGPYKFVSLDKDAQTSYYEAVDNYFKGEITIQKVSVRTFDSHESLIMGIVNDEIDVIYDYANPIDANLANSLEGNKDVDPGMTTNTGNFQLVFGFKKPVTSELNFRKAVSYALDYKLLATTIGGDKGEIAGAGIIPDVNKGYDPSIPRNEQNAELAVKTLEEAGYKDLNGDGYREAPDGSVLDIEITPQNNKARQALYLRMAEVIIQNLDKIGVKAHLDEKSVSNADYWNEVKSNGTYDIHLCYTSAGVATWRTAAFYIVGETGMTTVWGTYMNQDYIDAYNSMKNASNYDIYESNAKIIQKIHAEDLPAIGLAWDKAFFPYRTDKYTGWINYPGWGAINSQTWYTLRTK